MFQPSKTQEFDSIKEGPFIASVHYAALFKGSTSWLLTVKVLILMALAAINAFLEIESVCVRLRACNLSLERFKDVVMHADHVVLQSV